MNARHVKLPWILRLSLTELVSACNEEEHSRIQCTLGKTGYLKKKITTTTKRKMKTKHPWGC